MFFIVRRRAAFVVVMLAATVALGQTVAASFQNPLLDSGADPWVIFHDGVYYYTQTTGINLTLWKTRDITDLRHAEKKIVWTPPAAGPDSHDIWAPELHFLRGKWYLYFAADDGVEHHHRLWVLENSAADPLTGTWQMRGELKNPGDNWAIDPTVFENRGQLYVLWSGWATHTDDGVRSIYMARMKNPWTIQGSRIRLSTPEYSWEKFGDLHDARATLLVPHNDVNEGPEILQHDGKIFLVYSASGCWTDHYALGMMTASAAGDLMNPASWKKSVQPVFWSSTAAHAYGPGHNSFFPSPDGKQEWILYHANPQPGQGCGGNRQPRAQAFHWNADGSPDFGRPVPLNQPIAKPSGTK